MQLRKAERAKREFEMLTVAAKEARITQSIGKTLHEQQFYGRQSTESTLKNTLVPNNEPVQLS